VWPPQPEGSKKCGNSGPRAWRTAEIAWMNTPDDPEVAAATITAPSWMKGDELVVMWGKEPWSWSGRFGWMTSARALALTSKSSDAAQMIASAGATLSVPPALSDLARAYAAHGKYHDAWRSINEAMAIIKKTKERWAEAEVYRTAGEIALKSPEPDAAKAEAYFAHALAFEPNPGNSAPLRASHASGVTRARCSKRANCSPQFVAQH
jgi:tetratricopeptide (TPR) repeat protein